MNKNKPPKLITLAVIIALAVAARLIFHLTDLPNFAPIGAMALFGGAYYLARGRTMWLAFLIPILTVWISDWFIGVCDPGQGFTPFYEGFYWQYLAYALMVVLGSLLLKRVSPIALIGTSLLGSITFFVVSNFGVWASGYYPQNMAGLITCYEMGIPYFRGTLAGDLFFSCVLFGVFEMAKSKFPAVAAKPVAG